MATTIGQLGASAQSLTITAINSLAANTIGVSSAFDCTALSPDALDVQVEVTIDPGTTTGNKKAGVYIVTSIDGGTNYSDSTNRSNMIWLGDIYLPDTNIVRGPAMSVMAAMRGGFLPTHFKVAVWNDSGATFNSSGNSCQVREVSGEGV